MRLIINISIFLIFIASAKAFYCPSYLKNQTACTCEEFNDGAIVKCSGKGGPIVVEQLKTNKAEVRELWLQNAKIVEIGAAAFKPLKLKKLVIDNNLIKRIDDKAFKGLESTLQDLSISSNSLTSVPTSAFSGLRALNVLNLRCNNIGNLTETIFSDNPALIEVNLGCNEICSISKDVFVNVKSSLQNLILDNNCLAKVPTKALDGMKNLIALHMKYNKLTKLGSQEIVNVKSLSMVTFTGNQIDTVASDFVKNTQNIRYIYLNENKIKNVVPGTFKQFNNCEVIDLSYNKLSEVTENMFSGLENLQHLNMESNQIKDIAPGAFATTPLLLLWLPYNCLSSITPNMFQGTPFLKQISLAHNNIRNIAPLSFNHLANLHTLDLSYNKIGELETNAFTGNDIMNVRLQENPFVCTQDGFHILDGQEAVNLTTEANYICQRVKISNNTIIYLDGGDKDQCPNRNELPIRQPCCLRVDAHPPTTATPYTAPPTEATTAPSKEMMSAIERARERARKLNMERFLRLSKPPATPGKAPGSTIHLSAPGEGVAHHRTQNYRPELMAYLKNAEKMKHESQIEFSEDAPTEHVTQ